MVASLFSKGQASTIGLQSTSIRPLPIAYMITLHMIPIKGLGRRSGRNASPTSHFRGYNTGTVSDSVYIFCAECIYQKLSKEKTCRDQGDISKRNIIVMVEF